ncbi:hypothetical protein [Haloferula sp. BvORR071]|uniref:PP_RS20740 family protein n=1 Tax=Haloferula sp. BvORR071 TaxID=1396141 RepID=UPI00054D8EA4|nr:hypothetical protein [Haloferula sp. BvORR071]
MPDDEEDVMKRIFQGKISISLPEKPLTDFKPWHRPRKHYLRLKQWCHEAAKLIDSLGLKDGDELRYLGLPGEDLLDLWVLRGVCERAKVRLRYLGFDSSRRSASINLATHKVNSNDFIHPSSLILGDSLQSLLKEGSLGLSRADANAPYDIINLDLCDSVVDQAVPESYPNLEVVRALCDLQRQRRGRPWLLFLTTRVLKDGISEDALKRMFSCIIENIKSAADFPETLEKQLGISPGTIENATSVEEFDDEKWMGCHTLAFAKWLLIYLVKMQCSVRLLDSYVYNVVKTRKDMVSLGFLIEPVRLAGSDPSGMTVGLLPGTVQAIDEAALACAMVSQVSRMSDLDGMMEMEPEIFASFIEKKAKLLETVGYDPDAFRAWAAN